MEKIINGKLVRLKLFHIHRKIKVTITSYQLLTFLRYYRIYLYYLLPEFRVVLIFPRNLVQRVPEAERVM